MSDLGIQISDFESGTNLKEDNKLDQTEMKRRTKEFAKEIIRLCRKLPNNREGRLIGDQIFRSGTSVAANYRSACRAGSKADFISKLSIVEEEADETLFWPEVINEMKTIQNPKSSLSAYQPFLHGINRQPRSVVKIEFFHQVGAVLFHGF
jgi:four helix bundle protein